MTRISKEDSSQLHSPQSLKNSVARVEQLIAPARRVAAEMASLETGPISISNQPSFDCALGDLLRWGKACEDAFTERLKEMGHFRAEESGTAAATGTKGRKSQESGEKVALIALSRPRTTAPDCRGSAQPSSGP